MSYSIIKSIYAANFGPFAERVEFTLETEKGKKELLENTFDNDTLSFNKVAYILGGNGAGKSFFCKILRQIQSIIVLSPILASGNNQLLDSGFVKNMMNTVPIFKFEKAYEDKPTLLGVCIIIDKTMYTYEFTIKNGIIQTERLQKKYRRTETILERVGSSYTDITLKSELASFVPNLKVVKDEVLCLSMASFLNNELAMRLIAAIRDVQVLNMASLRVGMHIDEEAFNEERLKKYTKVLQKADPTMQSLKVDFKEKKVQKEKFSADDFENKEIIMATARIDVQSTHNVYSNGKVIKNVEMPFFETESSGTIKLFTVLPHLFNVLEDGGALIIDEIENGLHPNLVKEIVDLFYNEETNPKHAQLICTTHDVGLIEKGVRRDQVWIVAKNNIGQSSMDKIGNYIDIRGNVNIKQKYLEGILGKVPNTFFEN